MDESDRMANRLPRWRRFVTTAVVAGWLATLFLPPALLLRTRTAWLEQLDRPEVQAEWDAFKRDMRRQSGRDGPVQRKVPKSAEPPARVWLRDYFQLAVAAWLLFVGVLGGFFCLLVVGATRAAAAHAKPPVKTAPSSATGPSLSQNETRREDDDHQQHESDGQNTEK